MPLEFKVTLISVILFVVFRTAAVGYLAQGDAKRAGHQFAVAGLAFLVAAGSLIVGIVRQL